jgi:hypothetical protein
VHTVFWWGNLKERDHLEDPVIDGSIIFKWIFEEWDGDLDWINLSQDRDRWRAGAEISGSIICGEFLTS